jgi:hypothetical protein
MDSDVKHIIAYGAVAVAIIVVLDGAENVGVILAEAIAAAVLIA